MTNTPAIEVQDLVKSFRRELLHREYTTWKTLVLKPFQKRRSKEFVTVLNGVNLSVNPGKTLAIIGQNGSGKSTLLKILAGIYRADKGKVQVRGRVSSLIELGAGFHPEFTGRENVYLNGTILGLSKREIQKRFDKIVAYSGLGDYIDAPVRTYSSGMYVRLGFSVAVNVDPDVLLVDEVLAVGDEAFAHKCEDKINEFRRADKTICLVTHDMGAVEKYADEVIWLDGGCIAAQGHALPVIDAYRQKVAREEDAIRRESCQVELEEEKEAIERWGDGQVTIEASRLLGADGAERAVFQSGDPLTLEVDYRINQPVKDLIFGIGLFNANDVMCYGTNNLVERLSLGEFPPRGTVRMEFKRLDLVQGTYALDLAAHAKDGRAYDYYKRALTFAVRSSLADVGVFRPPHEWRVIAREAD